MLFVDCCLLIAVRCVGCRLSRSVFFCWLIVVGYCSLFAACYLACHVAVLRLFVWCSVCVMYACCLSVVVCCLQVVVCCVFLLFGVRCVLGVCC